MAQNRMYYAVYAAAIAPLGSTSYTSIHGLQSIGVTTRFNLEYIFEIGQLDSYSIIENLPDVEVTAEKVLDGYPLIYHLATYPSTEASLAGRSNAQCHLAVSYFTDTQQSASGTPLKQTWMSGLYTSSLTYTFPVQGNITESWTGVGNDKFVLTAGFTYTGGFTNVDAPPSGIQRRQHVLFGSGAGKSVVPTNLPGTTNFGGSGFVLQDGTFSRWLTHIQSIRTSTNLGRTPLYELGRKAPYFRTVDFPIEVRTDFEVYCQSGDGVTADSTIDNVTNVPIWIRIDDRTIFNLGTKNKLTSISETGGNAQQGGGNRSITFSYVNFNNLTITAPHDPSLL